MGRINWVPDLGAPAAVAAVDILADNVAVLKSNKEWIAYGLAALGYAGAYMNKGGDFVKNMGIAALPGAAKFLYGRVMTMTKKTTATAHMGWSPAAPGGYGTVMPFNNIELT